MRFLPRTTDYDNLVLQAKKLGPFKILSLVLGIVIAVVFTVVTFITQIYYLLIPAVVFILAGLIAFKILGSRFTTITRLIKQTYWKAYGPQNSTAFGYITDNCGLAGRLNQNRGFVCWLDVGDGTFKLISNDFLTITLAKKYDDTFRGILAKDFGVCVIDISKIDSYMSRQAGQVTLVIEDNGNVVRITFDDRAFNYFEAVIPQLEYHFKTAKKM